MTFNTSSDERTLAEHIQDRVQTPTTNRVLHSLTQTGQTCQIYVSHTGHDLDVFLQQ